MSYLHLEDFLYENNFYLYDEDSLHNTRECSKFLNQTFKYFKQKEVTPDSTMIWRLANKESLSSIEVISQKNCKDLINMQASFYEMRPAKKMEYELLATDAPGPEGTSYEYYTFNDIVDDIFWQPKSLIPKCLFKFLRFFTKISSFILHFLTFVLNVILFILKYPLLLISFISKRLMDIVSQLSYDYYYSHTISYDSCLQHSYMKAILSIAVIITAPFWMPFIWGFLKGGDYGFELAVANGLFYILASFFFFGTSISVIAGLLAIFIGHGEVEYTMSKHGYQMTNADLKTLDNAMTNALATWGISHFIERLL